MIKKILLLTFSLFTIFSFAQNFSDIKKEINQKIKSSSKNFYILVKENPENKKITENVEEITYEKLNEKYYKINSYSEVDIKLQEIEYEAKKRFTFNNRDKRKFNSPQAIHPKQPFKHYGDNKYEFHYYILAVKNILSMPEIHIYDKNALENLKNIYEKIRE